MMLRSAFLTLTLTLAAGFASAADPTLLNLVPKDPLLIAGVDVARAKNSAFGQRILAEMKDEDKGFREFVEATGFDPRKDLFEAVMASDGKTGENTVILASGTFNPTKIEAMLRAKGATPSSYGGVQLWTGSRKANPEGSIAFVGTSLAIFGKDPAVRAAIDRHSQKGPGLSQDLLNKITRWSANDAWVVTTAGLRQMGINNDGQNRVLPGGISSDAILNASAGVTFGTDIRVSGEALTRSGKDAQALADVFRFVVSMVRLNADKPEASEVLKVAESLQLNLSGSSITFALTIPEEMLDKMMQRKSPRAKAAPPTPRREVI